MKTLDNIFKDDEPANPEAIVGIYLTELDFIMVKVKLSNGIYLNKSIGKLSDFTGDEYKEIPRNLQKWRFVPCCE
jgi:hypothetical protein